MDPQTGPLFLFRHTRLPLTPFNVSKALHYNVQQMSCGGYWHIDTTSCLQPSLLIHMQFLITWMLRKSLRRNEFSFRCLWVNTASDGTPSNYVSYLPIQPCGVFGKVRKGHGCPLCFHLKLHPKEAIRGLLFSHQSRHTALCCIWRSWEMRFRCLPAPSHGMQACLPEARGKRQCLVFVL